MARWKIYYEDGSTFSDGDGSLKDAPAFGVMCVICEPGAWRGGDLAGLIDFLAQSGIVKFGRLTENDTYQRVLTDARQDGACGDDRYVLERVDYYWSMDGV